MGLRASYVTGLSYLLLCAGMLFLATPRPRDGLTVRPAAVTASGAPAAGGSPAAEWFAAARPSCNVLEVETRLRASPAPATTDGAGYRAACLALAGKIQQAQQTIDALAAPEQWRAAAIVFEVGHPVADLGDDQSAGPIMRLVLRYWPNNYMALYHAGMSEYVLGDDAQGRAHLEEFLRLYQVNDGFTQRAKAALAGQRPLPGAHE